VNAHHEHEFEAAPGLPEPLPKGERMIWQGSPDFRMLAIHAFHVRKLALYFTAMLALQWIYLSADPAAPLVRPLLTSAGMALLALGLLTTIAWFSARTTLYTLTDRRIVMRIGIVLTLTFNLPLRQVSGAAIKPQGAGHGDIALTLSGSDRIAWLNLWPHARPWQLRQPQPSLRCVPDAQAVGARIQQAWNVVHPEAIPVRGEAVQLPVRPPRENRVPAVTA
jgi:hypothetical protein